MLKKFAFLAILITAFGLSVSAQERSRYSGTIRGTNYVYNYTEKDFAETPSWKVEEGEPPVSVARAVQIARTNLPRFVENAEKFKINGAWLQLANNDKWFYKIKFFCIGAGCRNLPTREFAIIVKMDGSILEPKKLGTVD